MTAADEVIHDGDGGLLHVDTFLDAKLNPPTPRWNWVRRDRLMRVLERAASECSVTLVAAPAGYGKTTVVAQWLSESDSRRLAWIALDGGDNDPVRLWTHIATALERAGCSLPADAASFVASRGTTIIAELLPAMINSISQVAEPVLVVLDDYHFIRATECHEQISFLISHLPTSAGVVILTRADPELRLGRLRVAGQLAEIRAEQLSFDRDETSVLLSLEDIRLSDSAIVELIERTEGWPAGLYLAILSMAGRDDPEAFIREFRGDDRYIGDYLTEEVLSRHSEDARAFILAVSILDRFSAALCDYMLQIDGSSSILHELERTNLFLVPLDAKRQWFRFHHLFAAVTRSEFEAASPCANQRAAWSGLGVVLGSWLRRRSRTACGCCRLRGPGRALGASQLAALRRRRPGRHRARMAARSAGLRFTGRCRFLGVRCLDGRTDRRRTDLRSRTDGAGRGGRRGTASRRYEVSGVRGGHPSRSGRFRRPGGDARGREESG